MRPGPVLVNADTNDAEYVLKLKKKRGVYVEKKLSKSSAHSKASSRTSKLGKHSINNQSKALNSKKINSAVPRRPPASSFVNNVLDILSKTTVDTRYSSRHTQQNDSQAYDPIIPEAENKEEVFPPLPPTHKERKNKMNQRNKKIFNHPEKRYKSPAASSTSKKNRPKPSNTERPNYYAKSYTKTRQKQLFRSPSISLSSDSQDGLSWMDYMDENEGEVFINKENTTEIPVEIDYENNQVVKEINEGKKLNEERSRHEESGPNKTIYNFFVDVLQTIKPDYHVDEVGDICLLKDSSEELKQLTIDEKVAQRLAFKKKEKPIVNLYGIGDDEQSDSTAEHFDIVNPEPRHQLPRCQRLIQPQRKSRSFVYNKPKKLPKSHSFTYKAATTKVAKKKQFLAMIKQKLTSSIERESHRSEEPKNMYEALKIMAKNKAPPPKVRFKESRNACPVKERKAALRRNKPGLKRVKKPGYFDVRYPIEAEVDSRYVHSIYNPSGESFGSLHVYGENYILHQNESASSDLCNRFSIASFVAESKTVKSRSSPMSVARRSLGNRSMSPFSR